MPICRDTSSTEFGKLFQRCQGSSVSKYVADEILQVEVSLVCRELVSLYIRNMGKDTYASIRKERTEEARLLERTRLGQDQRAARQRKWTQRARIELK